MGDSTFLSLLPPLAAIVLAIATRQVVLSLFMGIFLGHCLLFSGNVLSGLAASLDSLVQVFADGGNTKVIFFSLLVGSFIALIRASGGVEAFVAWGTQRQWVRGEKSAGLFAYVVGLIVFIESSITCLIAGTVAKPFFDKFRMSREKLAYIVDSTSAPVCMLIPLNGWGAFLIGLLSTQGADAPVGLLVSSLVFAFYPIVALVLVPLVILRKWDWGWMAEAKPVETPYAAGGEDIARPQGSVLLLVLPVLVLILAMPVFLWVTGEGNMIKGSGSTSVFWAVLLAVFFATVFYWGKKILSLQRAMDIIFQGMGELLPIVLILVLAFALGSTCKSLGTGPYVAGLVQNFPLAWLVPGIVFLASALIAFSTGTSWGTFAIMVPIVYGLHDMAGVSLPLILGAVLSGGIFGDHSSPISDTTIVSSLASGCDHIRHVKTQLPYALAAGGVSLILYLASGIVAGL